MTISARSGGDQVVKRSRRKIKRSVRQAQMAVAVQKISRLAQSGGNGGHYCRARERVIVPGHAGQIRSRKRAGCLRKSSASNSDLRCSRRPTPHAAFRTGWTTTAAASRTIRPPVSSNRKCKSLSSRQASVKSSSKPPSRSRTARWQKQFGRNGTRSFPGPPCCSKSVGCSPMGTMV